MPATRPTSAERRHRASRVDHAVREPPFIVVPADNTHQLAVNDRGFKAVDGRARAGVHEVDRDQRLVGVIENALETPAFGGRLEDLVDLVTARVAAWREREIDKTDVGDRYADRRAVEFALEFGEYLTHRASRTGRRRDYRHRRSAG